MPFSGRSGLFVLFRMFCSEISVHLWHLRARVRMPPAGPCCVSENSFLPPVVPRVLTGKTASLTVSFWTLESKIPLTSWEVSTLRFHPLVNLGALGISKTIVTITLKQCGHSLFSITNWTLILWASSKEEPVREQFERALKAFWVSGRPNQLVGLGLLNSSYKFI